MLTCSFAPNKPKLLPLMAASCVYSSTGTCAGTLRSLFTVVLRSFEVQDTDAIQALGGSTALTPDFFTQQTVVNFN